MQTNPLSLQAISPIDGRYSKNTERLVPYFSEFALIQYRVRVEIEYFLALCKLPLPQLVSFPKEKINELQDLFLDFSMESAERIKALERITNHDVKAVEYFIKEEFDKLGLSEYKEFIHFGLTSQDINNTSIPLSIKEMLEEEYLPLLSDIIVSLNERAEEWEEIALLARTHGQAASPTRLGKEIQVFTERIDQQLRLLRFIPFSAKFGGATGNMNAHYVAYPDIDWHAFATDFVEETLGLSRSYPTTQIEHYDNLAALCDTISRINTILTDFCRDIWTYISMDYFKQKIKSTEVGSSAMPHKVNPIDFENAEGNFGVANALFHHFSAKLPISRLQRDLTDSTVLRNIGVPFGHSFISMQSLLRGLGKLIVNTDAIQKDLRDNWAVVAEAIQTVLRREGFENPYETLKALSRTNAKPGEAEFLQFINELEIPEGLKIELRAITPFNYTGK
jgi:adenylosuccinate lyase